MEVKISKARNLLVTAVASGVVPMLYSSPGMGKSDLVRSIADERGLEVIDLRLSQCDPTDLNIAA